MRKNENRNETKKQNWPINLKSNQNKPKRNLEYLTKNGIIYIDGALF